MTLTELMVAVAIMSVAALGLLGAFAGIQKATQVSKSKTFAANLAQEQMQILGQKNYYELLVTPVPSFNVNYTPNIPFDPTYFPPQTILEGGGTYTRLTYVQVAQENSGVIQVLPPATPDTGMRLVTVSVLWTQGAENKVLTVNSIMSNPNTVESDSIFTGKMSNSVGGALINGGLVNIAENMGWRDTTDVHGVYSINASPGSYTMVASAPGFYSQFLPISVAAAQTVTQNFSMVAIATGTVKGTVWMNDRVIISQVVPDTFTFCQDASNALTQRDVEYIEFFNPTASQVYMGATGDNYFTNYNSLWYYSQNGNGAYQFHNGNNSQQFDITYVTTTVPAFSYFLYANTPRFMINGVYVTADAYFTPATGGVAAPDIPHYLSAAANIGTSGYVEYAHYPFGAFPVATASDSVGWTDSTPHTFTPWWTPLISTPTIFNCNTCGYTSLGSPKGNQIVRLSSPTVSAAGMTAFGHAYNSQNNQYDWQAPSLSFSGITYVPHNVSSGTFTEVAGKPAAGAVISSNDGLSSPTTAFLVGAPPVASFILTNVATTSVVNPWIVLITSSSYSFEDDTVTIPSPGAFYTYPSSTTILNLATNTGFITGTVTDVFGAFISPGVVMSPKGAGNNQTTSTSDGRYLLRVSTGSVDVVANNGNANSSYVSISSLAVSVYAGQISDNVNFILSQGGRISGFVTRDGSNALPGVAVSALDVNGYARDTQVTDNNGRFTTIDIATGVYIMTPELDSLETSTPTGQSTTVGMGQTVFSATFTITGALGTISGTVTVGSKPITTGVLVVVTTSSLAGSPPAPPSLSSATLASNSYYVTSSLEDGSWSIGVRQSTTTLYNAYGYFTSINSTGAVTFQSQTLSNISVVAGSSVTGFNFAW